MESNNPINKSSENYKISKKINFIRDPKILRIYRPGMVENQDSETEKDQDKKSK